MSDNNDILRTGNGHFRMFADTLALMMKGAGYALIFCFFMGLIYAVLLAVGAILPEQSKERPDPTPYSHMMAEPAAVRLI